MKKAQVAGNAIHETWSASARVAELRNGRHDQDTWATTPWNDAKLEKAEMLLEQVRTLVREVANG